MVISLFLFFFINVMFLPIIQQKVCQNKKLLIINKINKTRSVRFRTLVRYWTLTIGQKPLVFLRINKYFITQSLSSCFLYYLCNHKRTFIIVDCLHNETELGKWLLDIAKYLVTAVLLASVFSDIEEKLIIYIVVSIAIIITLGFGLYLVRDKKEKEEK